MQKFDKTAYLLLAIFTGWIGMHKFYVRQRRLGVLYLIFAFSSIPFALSVFDILRAAPKSQAELEQEYSEVAGPQFAWIAALGFFATTTLAVFLLFMSVPSAAQYLRQESVADLRRFENLVVQAETEYFARYGVYSSSADELNLTTKLQKELLNLRLTTSSAPPCYSARLSEDLFREQIQFDCKTLRPNVSGKP